MHLTLIRVLLGVILSAANVLPEVARGAAPPVVPSNATPPVLSRLRDDDWDSDGSFDDGAKAYTPTWGDLAGIPYHTAPEGEEEAGESDGSGMDPESYKEAVLMLHKLHEEGGWDPEVLDMLFGMLRESGTGGITIEDDDD